MLKKWMTAIILIGVLSGCGNTSTTDNKNEDTPKDQAAAATQTESTTPPANDTKEGTKEATKEETKIESSADYKSLEHEQFSISYPKDWVTYDEKQLANSVVKAGYYDPKPSGKFATNLNVTVTPGASFSAKDIADNATKVLQENGEANGMKDYKPVEFKEVDHGGYKAGISTSSYSNPQTGTDVMLTQLIVPAKNNTYALSFSTPKDIYDQYKGTIIKDVIDSFTIKE